MFENISDLRISTRQIEESLFFPGPRKVTEVAGLVEYCQVILEQCQKIDDPDFGIQQSHNNERLWWRGHWNYAVVDGKWLCLRKSDSEPPRLDSLRLDIPVNYREQLMSRDLSKGGLVLITGGPGSGKTTTASATVVSRLEAFGGVCFAVEDPPEKPLNGWHGESGYCTQSRVINGSKNPNAWNEALSDALRSQPTATSTMLFVGEIRDNACAQMAMKAANEGFLVITTSFANDIQSGIQAFIDRLGNTPDALSSLAAQLRLVVYQKIVPELDILQVKTLQIRDGLPAMIRRGQLHGIENEVNSQQHQLLNASFNAVHFQRAA